MTCSYEHEVVTVPVSGLELWQFFLLKILAFDFGVIIETMQTRNSNQRKIILEIMKDNYSHPTADEIFEEARKVDAHISRGTVYRNLGILSEQGEILKVSVPDGSDHYDSTLTNHYHFCCSKCEKMFDIPESVTIETEKVASTMAKEGFSVYSHSLIFNGICPECRE